jgi:hypothetical protein
MLCAENSTGHIDVIGLDEAFGQWAAKAQIKVCRKQVVLVIERQSI